MLKTPHTAAAIFSLTPSWSPVNKPYILLVVLFAFACGTSSPSAPSATTAPSASSPGAAASATTAPSASSPGATASATTPSSAGSLEGTWQLVALEGTPIADKKRFNITFKGDEVRGHGGCNSFWATAKQTGGELVLEALAATEKGCDLFAQESAYLKALKETRSFTITSGVLEFRSSTGAKLVSFER